MASSSEMQSMLLKECTLFSKLSAAESLFDVLLVPMSTLIPTMITDDAGAGDIKCKFNDSSVVAVEEVH